MTTDYLSFSQVAERIGLAPATVKSYIERGMLPDPDARIGKIKGWLPETVDEWQANRPGSGNWRDRRHQ